MKTSLSLTFFLIASLSFAQEVKQVNATIFKQNIENQAGILLDVRTLNEFQNGHLENAGQLNFYSPSFYKKLFLLPKNEPIYLYCNTGYRSNKAAKKLIEQGYSSVYNLEHGILEWELKNYPTQLSPDRKPDRENEMSPEEFIKITSGENLVFVDFYAPWCAPCQRLMPLVDSLHVEYLHKIDFVKVNIDASKKLVKQMGLLGVPYLAIYYKGELLYDKKGMANREELETNFNSLLYNN